MKKKHLFIALIIYIVSAVGAYSVMSVTKSSGSESGEQQSVANDANENKTALGSLLQIDPNEPKDQQCPLNGAMYTQTERDAWEEKRPLFVMIENSVDARPQSGLSRADIIFEAIAEGGVTRFGAIFYCASQRDDTLIAPIRSARTYFVDWASGFNQPLYVHVGGANLPGPTNALGQIEDYGWELENDINQFSVGYPTFVRNYNRLDGKEIATEHTMETSSERLWKVAAKRDWTQVNPEGERWLDGYKTWTFEEEPADAGTVETVAYDFWSGYSDWSAEWQYDAAQDVFLRSTGGQPHFDLNNDERVRAANVIVLKTVEEGPINELRHMLYKTTGTGNALIFKHGDVIEANWTKMTRESELEFTNDKGQPVALARGPVWISVVGLGTEVTY